MYPQKTEVVRKLWVALYMLFLQLVEVHELIFLVIMMVVGMSGMFN